MYRSLLDVHSTKDAAEYIGGMIQLLEIVSPVGEILSGIEKSCIDEVRLSGQKLDRSRSDARVNRQLVAGAALVLRTLNDVGWTEPQAKLSELMKSGQHD